MSKWTVKLFGRFAVEGAAGEEAKFRTRQTRQVLACLALHMGRKVARTELCRMAWPSLPSDRARQSLRTALSDVRARLGSEALHADRDWAWLNADLVEVDVERFARTRDPGDCPDRLLPDWDEPWVREYALELDSAYEEAVAHALPSLDGPAARALAERCLARIPASLIVRAKLRELGWTASSSAARRPATSFVGRRRELDHLARLLEERRLVTITGVGGIGKTRLAINLQSRFRRAWFVSLGDCQHGGQIEEAIRVQIGLPEGVGRSAFEQVVFALGDADGLLVLDNFEHLVEAAHVAESLVERCPHLRIVATSQVPLRTPSEACFPLGPLALEGVNGGASEAAELLCDRIGSVLPGFRPLPDAMPLVDQICQRVDGFPLAIELAAAKLRVHSLAEVVAQLDEAFEFLRTDHGRRRHQSLRGALDWSYDRLQKGEQEALLDLSVFRGGFALAGARQVLDEANAADVLDGLVAAAWAERVGGLESVRFRLLESIRQYAAELVPPRREREIRGRHAAWLLQMAQTNLDLAFTPDEEAHHRKVEAEEANIDAACAWLMEENPSLAVELVGGLSWFYVLRGQSPIAEAKLKQALAKAPGMSGPSYGYAHHAMANFLIFQGRFREAEPWLQKSIEIARAHGIALNQAISTQQLAYVCAETGDFDRADELIEAAALLVASHENVNWRGTMATMRALICNRRGNWSAALMAGEAAMAYCREGGYAWGLASLLNEMAQARRRLGEWERSLDHELEGLAIKRRLNAPRTLAISLIGLAETYLGLRQARPAASSLAEACQLLRSLADWHSLPDVFRVGAQVALEAGDQRLAEACRESEKWGRSHSDRKDRLLLRLSELVTIL